MLCVCVCVCVCVCTASSRHAAYNVSVVETTSDSVTLSWYPAYDGGHDIHYVLWYYYYVFSPLVLRFQGHEKLRKVVESLEWRCGLLPNYFGRLLFSVAVRKFV